MTISTKMQAPTFTNQPCNNELLPVGLIGDEESLLIKTEELPAGLISDEE